MDTERHTLLDDSSKLRTELAEKYVTVAGSSINLCKYFDILFCL